MDLESENERLAHGICDVLDLLDAEGGTDLKWAGAARAILRGLLVGTEHEGHRPIPTHRPMQGATQ